MNSRRIDNRHFFNDECVSACKRVLGKILVRRMDNGVLLKGRIVEVEAYCGVNDAACHSYQNKQSKRNEAMFSNSTGTIYVYNIDGVYC